MIGGKEMGKRAWSTSETGKMRDGNPETTEGKMGSLCTSKGHGVQGSKN